MIIAILSIAEEKMIGGIIVKKEFVPAHEVHTSITFDRRIATNKTITTIVPVVRYYKDQWKIEYEGYNKCKKIHNTRYVSEKRFNKYEIGDIFIPKLEDKEKETYREVVKDY
jgi:hypothetical protein